jgi:hypothetical protein
MSFALSPAVTSYSAPVTIFSASDGRKRSGPLHRCFAVPLVAARVKGSGRRPRRSVREGIGGITISFIIFVSIYPEHSVFSPVAGVFQPEQGENVATYLITGGAGFIGRSLCEDLRTQGHSIRIIDALVDQVHGDAVPVLPKDVEFIHGDVRSRPLLERALRDVEGVFHLAAEVGVGQSMYEISRYVGANDLGTAVLLETLIDHPVRRLVVASSMSVYGEGRYVADDGSMQTPARRLTNRGGS